MSRRKNNRGVQRFNVEPVDNVGPEYFMGGKDGNNIDGKYLSDNGNDLDWSTVICKRTGRGARGGKDCSISVIKAHEGNAFAFTFRKDEFKKMYDRKYMMPVLSYNKKRMYFVEKNEAEGFRVCREAHQANSYMRIKDNDHYAPFVGEHDIKWEPSRRCYYIELNE